MIKSNPFKLSLVLMTLVGCATQAGQTPAASQSDPTSTVTPQPTRDTPDSAETPAVENSPASLSPEWIVYIGRGGLWRVRPDGSDPTLLYEYEFPPIPDFFEQGLSPDGQYLAFMTSPYGYNYDSPTLTILSMPSGEVHLDIPLNNPETNPDPGAGAGDPKLEALRAIVEVDSFAWSPDGSQLAFVGLMDGPSSDLYVVSMDSGAITRLTDGPTQAIRPVWSPDDRYIVHSGVSALEGQGVGFTVAAEGGLEGVWAAAVDGSEVKLLYEPDSRDEVVVGWKDPSHFVVHAWQTRCGNENLRIVDIANGSQQILWEGAFDHVAVDPTQGTVLLGVSQKTATCNSPPQAGLFYGIAPVRILDDEIQSLIWSSEAQLFLALTEFGPVAVSPGGDYIDLDVQFAEDRYYTFPPSVESGTRQLAWASSEGLWIGRFTSGLDNPPHQFFTEPVGSVFWGKDSGWLYFISGGDLYSASPPTYAPVMIADFPGIMAVTTLTQSD